MISKPLAITLIAASVLTACNSLPHVTKKTQEPIVFAEPNASAPFYALNPNNYNLPSDFELHLQKAAAQPVVAKTIADPNNPSQNIVLNKNLLIIPTINSNTRSMKYAVMAEKNELDVTQIDDFLHTLEGKARHYPPQFADRQERRGYSNKLKQVSQQLDVLAANPNASLDILVRAFKASVMGRNLDLGSSYTTKSLGYAQRILKINKTDPETNFWFGFALSEGGGQREAIPYLNAAMSGNVQEAYLAAVNNYLWLDQRKNALQLLNNYKLKYPTEAEVTDRLIKEIQSQGRWNVWQLTTPKK